MKYPIYSYRDNKSDSAFGVPLVEENELTAVRRFSYEINNSGMMHFAPSDFDLYKIGEFDSKKGELVGCLPEFVVSGSSVFNSK